MDTHSTRPQDGAPAGRADAGSTGTPNTDAEQAAPGAERLARGPEAATAPARAAAGRPTRRTLIAAGGLGAAGALAFAGPAAAEPEWNVRSARPGSGNSHGHGLKKGQRADAPRSVRSNVVPAAYEQTSDDPADYGSYDLAGRRAKDIDYIVIHDTEADYEGTLKIFTDPKNQTSAHYVVAGSGLVTQMVDVADAAWHAGNWHFNGRSIGIEMVGQAESKKGFTQAQYTAVGRLVRYLCRKYDIPLDREHIVGHEEVPATTVAGVAKMHWDPGPLYSFERLIERAGGRIAGHGGRHAKTVVAAPDDRSNTIDFRNADGTAQLGRQGVFAVPVRTAPRDDAPLFADPGLHPDGKGPAVPVINDWGSNLTGGQTFAVAGRAHGWTQIHYAGTTAWVKDTDAAGRRALEPGRAPHGLATPRGKRTVKVYGAAYPGAAAFERAGVDAPKNEALPYTIEPGARYVVGGRLRGSYQVAEDYGKPGRWVRDSTAWVEVRIGHRVGFVHASDVRIVR
ncbi:N-acetylmuramoyl-L-alanine amidase [Brevibacterium sp. 5221]|uniref:N-acetylmuramoyl-L-alanine amidase n=1 Tax=Brevibacterium rongguiense TaxID=2695267 RepID=A0A6N9H4E2_9MICO|nr:peptidoglycan recognition family protein [Brevibacterium rongguiense]MYM18701.1 N-acetylmuramoyl-L-alanine amidase [Brevibacterium rongguiense]